MANYISFALTFTNVIVIPKIVGRKWSTDMKTIEHQKGPIWKPKKNNFDF